MDPEAFSIKLAHISDLHFSKLNFGMLQFFSKRWIGNLNLLFRRRKVLLNDQPFTIIPYLKELGITHVVISGDLTTTSFRKEFELARQFLQELYAIDCKVFLIPGNHDSYTKASHKGQLFYKYLNLPKPTIPHFSLEKDKVAAYMLGHHYWLVLIDTTYPAWMFSSTGHYLTSTDTRLRALLKELPQDATVILVNHFPLFQHEGPRRIMHGAKKLQDLVKEHPNCKIYLHGHTHRLCFADLTPNNMPIILDSGCLSHVTRGSWNLLELTRSHLHVKVFHKSDTSQTNQDKGKWSCIHKHSAQV